MSENDTKRPEWTLDSNSTRVWIEDDADVLALDHESIISAWSRVFGEDYPDISLAEWDAGDGEIYRLFPEGRVAFCCYPGSSEIRILKPGVASC